MNLLIVGNGFDLAHGLPTKYMDFLFFCTAFKIISKKIEADKIRYDEELVNLKKRHSRRLRRFIEREISECDTRRRLFFCCLRAA